MRPAEIQAQCNILRILNEEFLPPGPRPGGNSIDTKQCSCDPHLRIRHQESKALSLVSLSDLAQQNKNYRTIGSKIHEKLLKQWLAFQE